MKPAEIARKLIGYLNDRDLDGAEEYWHRDLVEDFVVLGTFRGAAQTRGFFEELFGAFPDFYLAIENIVGDDEIAFIAWEAGGTFNGGTFQGIQPNGAHVVTRGVDRMEFKDGKLIRNTIYYDGAGFMRAVGMLPAQSSGAENVIKHAFNAVTAVRRRIGV